MDKSRKGKRWLGFIFLGLILGACSGLGDEFGQGGSVITEPLEITEVTLVSDEIVPVRLRARVSGAFHTSCTTIKEPEQSREYNRFMIEIMTERPRDQECGSVEGKYEEIFELNLKGLPAGYYILDVNGVVQDFSLAEDQPG